MNDLVYVNLLHGTLVKNASRPCLHIKRDNAYKSWTYEQFHRDLNRLTSQLRKCGLKKSMNAIVIGENSPEWLIAHHSILLTGACTVPVDPGIPPSEIESITVTTEAKIIFCTLPYYSLFTSLKSKHHFIDKVILLDDKADDKENFSHFIQGGNDKKEAFSQEFSPDDPMVIIFTSGTTGRAKGVVLSQKNFTAVSNFGILRMKLTINDIACAVLPLHHVFGFAASISGPLAAGCGIVFVPHVKGPLILEALRDKEITYFPAVPKMLGLFYESILHNVKKKGPLVRSIFTGMKTLSATAGNTLGTSFQRSLFSSVHKSFGGKLRLIISGGAALNKKHWIGFRQMGFLIVEGYGLTETYGPITVTPGEDARWGSVGPALPGNEISIHEPDSSGIGEVLLRGTCVFKGYYKNDEATKAVFDENGWFHTGDLGRLDNDGFLYLSGRKKDMIVLDTGKNVYPDELEDVYGTSPLIEEIGIFGVKTDDGEIVAAAIVPSGDIRKSNSIAQATDIIYDELIRIGKTLPVYRRISDFVTVYNPLPRTTTKKLKKQELLKLYNSIKRKSGVRSIDEEQLSVLEMALMETEEYAAIINAIATISPKTEPGIINPRSHLEIDLSLDSLQRIELLTLLEKRFTITVPEILFEKMETMADIVSLLRENRENSKTMSISSIISLKERILNESPAYVKLPSELSIIERTAGPLYRNTIGQISKASVSGIENFASISTPIIFASNHSHPDDIFTILESLPESIRKDTFFFIENKSTQYSPVLAQLYSSNMINPGKENDPIELLRLSIAVIRNQKNLVAFPEGTIGKPGILGPFKSGIGLLSRETSATIIPVKLCGPKHLLSKSNSLKGKSVIFGEPVTYSAFRTKGNSHLASSTDELINHVRSVIEKM